MLFLIRARLPEIRQWQGRLPAFNAYVDGVWLPNHAAKYFADRDPKALEYLPKLLPKPQRKAG